MTMRAHKTLLSLIAIPFVLLFAGTASAAGVPANTAISNTAIIDYEVDGTAVSTNATSTFTVVELLDVSLLWQDAANVNAMSPENNAVIAYTLTNTGNGIDQYLLAVDGTLTDDDFDIAPIALEIWIDDGDGVWSAVSDVQYDGSNGPVLNGGVDGSDSAIIFVVANVPSGQPVGALTHIQLKATSATADNAGEAGNAGAELAGAGDGGVNANVGLTGAIATATGTIEIISSGVSINKSVVAIDTLGGNDPHTGATLRYTLSVQVAGNNTVSNLVVTDPIPNGTTYTAGSITLDGTPQTDAQDMPSDFSDFNVGNTGSITVDLSESGSRVITPPANFIIEFEVTID